MEVSEAEELCSLPDENQRLKKLVAGLCDGLAVVACGSIRIWTGPERECRYVTLV